MEAINTTVVGDNSSFYAQPKAVQSEQATGMAQAAAATTQTAGAATQAVATDFATELRTLVCPQCNSLFGAEVLSFVPKMTAHTTVEADFHRLLPHASFRGALVTICPACEFAGWVEDFGRHTFPAELVPAAAELEPSLKYAYAIKKGREIKSPALNLALLSLNGLWCARQENKAIAPWLELAIKELTDALDDDSWRGNRHYYRYLRGELKRQNSDFAGSLQDFEQTTAQMKVPKELIERQKELALAGNSEPILLPSHIVQQIFCFTPGAASAPNLLQNEANKTTETTWKT